MNNEKIMNNDLKEYTERMIKEGIRETIDKHIDDNHWVHYYYSNCDGDAYSSFTFYEGKINLPEYSREVLHTINMDKRFTIEELIPFCKDALDNLNSVISKKESEADEQGGV